MVSSAELQHIEQDYLASQTAINQERESAEQDKNTALRELQQRSALSTMFASDARKERESIVATAYERRQALVAPQQQVTSTLASLSVEKKRVFALEAGRDAEQRAYDKIIETARQEEINAEQYRADLRQRIADIKAGKATGNISRLESAIRNSSKWSGYAKENLSEDLQTQRNKITAYDSAINKGTSYGDEYRYQKDKNKKKSRTQELQEQASQGDPDAIWKLESRERWLKKAEFSTRIIPKYTGETTGKPTGIYISPLSGRPVIVREGGATSLPGVAQAKFSMKPAENPWTRNYVSPPASPEVYSKREDQGKPIGLETGVYNTASGKQLLVQTNPSQTAGELLSTLKTSHYERTFTFGNRQMNVAIEDTKNKYTFSVTPEGMTKTTRPTGFKGFVLDTQEYLTDKKEGATTFYTDKVKPALAPAPGWKERGGFGDWSWSNVAEGREESRAFTDSKGWGQVGLRDFSETIISPAFDTYQEVEGGVAKRSGLLGSREQDTKTIFDMPFIKNKLDQNEQENIGKPWLQRKVTRDTLTSTGDFSADVVESGVDFYRKTPGTALITFGVGAGVGIGLKGLAVASATSKTASFALKSTKTLGAIGMTSYAGVTTYKAFTSPTPGKVVGRSVAELGTFVAGLKSAPIIIKGFTAIKNNYPGAKPLERTGGNDWLGKEGNLPGKGRRSRQGRTKAQSKTLSLTQRSKMSRKQAYNVNVKRGYTNEGQEVLQVRDYSNKFGKSMERTRQFIDTGNRNLVGSTLSNQRFGNLKANIPNIKVRSRVSVRRGGGKQFFDVQMGKGGQPSFVSRNQPKAPKVSKNLPAVKKQKAPKLVWKASQYGKGYEIYKKSYRGVREPSVSIGESQSRANIARNLRLNKGNAPQKTILKSIPQNKDDFVKINIPKRTPGQSKNTFFTQRGKLPLDYKPPEVVEMVYQPRIETWIAQRNMGGFRAGMKEKLFARLYAKATPPPPVSPTLEAPAQIQLALPSPQVATQGALKPLQSVQSLSSTTTHAEGTALFRWLKFGLRVEAIPREDIRSNLMQEQAQGLDLAQAEALRFNLDAREAQKEEQLLDQQYFPVYQNKYVPLVAVRPTYEEAPKITRKTEIPLERKPFVDLGFEPSRPPPGEKIPEEIIEKEKLPKWGRQKDTGGFFGVQVKTQGKFVQIKQESLSLREATRLGALITDTTPSASFKVTQEGKGIKAKRALSFLGGGFRQSKVFSDVIVERRSRRINTAGEVGGISLKGGKKSKSLFKIRRGRFNGIF